MNVIAATFTTSLQIHCRGTATASAKAILGNVLRDHKMLPGDGRVFFGYELIGTVIGSTATIEANLLDGYLEAAVGSPNIVQNADPLDWEGLANPTMDGVRALLIEDMSPGVNGRQILVYTQSNQVITVPHGGHVMLVAQRGKLLDSDYHGLTFKTNVSGQAASFKLTALTEWPEV